LFKKYNFRNYNFILLFLVVILMIIGILVINAADSYYTNKQTIGVIVAFVIIVILSLIDYHFVLQFYIPFFILNALLLLAVLFFGADANNAKRWFALGPVTFQPSELTKILMILFMAKVLGMLIEKDTLNTFRGYVVFGVTALIPALLISQQPDLSTTLCFLIVMFIMIYAAGLSYKVIGIAILVLIPLAGMFLWYVQSDNQTLLYDYQVNRILSFIYPSQYADTYEQQLNSIMAIGSGQLSGKGLGAKTATGFISERQTDFIFSVVGESFGFVGSVIIIAIILVVVLQCIRIARRSRDAEGMLISVGVGALIGFQSFINIGVATAFLPNTGIPLPFISYGLSSLLSMALCIGMVLNVGLQRKK